MVHRYAGWKTVIALVAVVAAACSSDDGNDAAGVGAGAFPGAGAPAAGAAGVAGGVAGQLGAGVGGAAAGNPAPTAGASGTAGAQPGAAGAAGVAGVAAGAGGEPTAGTAAGAGGEPTAGTAAGAGGEPTAGMAGGAPMAGNEPAASGSCVPATSVDADGPFTPAHIETAGPGGGSWVFYPEDLGRDGMLHPVFVWGPGALTGPREYTDHLNRLASHGFVVISQPSSGTGTTEKAALDWMLAENDMSGSMFYQKLDPTRVGMGGHSLGSLTTMAMAGDQRLTMYILVCGGCMSGSGGCGAADIHGPTVILGGDSDIGTPNFEGDYDEITQPVVFLTKDGTDHIACARNNLAPWVAFMRWQLCGEDQWSADFFDGGEYCATPWDCKSKNF